MSLLISSPHTHSGKSVQNKSIVKLPKNCIASGGQRECPPLATPFCRLAQMSELKSFVLYDTKGRR